MNPALVFARGQREFTEIVFQRFETRVNIRVIEIDIRDERDIRRNRKKAAVRFVGLDDEYTFSFTLPLTLAVV